MTILLHENFLLISLICRHIRLRPYEHMATDSDILRPELLAPPSGHTVCSCDSPKIEFLTLSKLYLIRVDNKFCG